MATNMVAKERVITEQGFVISKHFQKATESWTKDGKVYPGKPSAFILTCISSYEQNSEFGLADPTLLEYAVDEETYNKARFMDECIVKFAIDIAYNRARALSVQIRG